MSREDRISKLATGEPVQYRESGNSMAGIIEHRQLITARKVTDFSTLKEGDAVFCKVRGNYYTHLIKAIRKVKKDGVDRYEFQIGNNHGGINGWTWQENIYGKVTHVG
jgi:LPXTG-site transpeptidase (sortase) family protein